MQLYTTTITTDYADMTNTARYSNQCNLCEGPPITLQLQLVLVVYFHPAIGANTALAPGQLVLCGGMYIYIYIYIYIYSASYIYVCVCGCLNVRCRVKILCIICEGEGDLQFVCGLYCVSLEHLHIQLLVLYCYY